MRIFTARFLALRRITVYPEGIVEPSFLRGALVPQRFSLPFSASQLSLAIYPSLYSEIGHFEPLGGDILTHDTPVRRAGPPGP